MGSDGDLQRRGIQWQLLRAVGPGKHCLLLTANWKGGLTSQSSGIGGWSPDRKQYVEHWYGSNGDKLNFRYSLGKKKGVWVGTFTAVDKDGKESSGDISLEKSADEFRYRGIRTSGGEKLVVETVNKKTK